MICRQLTRAVNTSSYNFQINYLFAKQLFTIQKNKDSVVRLLSVNKAKAGLRIHLGRAHGSRDRFVLHHFLMVDMDFVLFLLHKQTLKAASGPRDCFRHLEFLGLCDAM